MLGASGYLGQHVARRLATEGHEVTALFHINRVEIDNALWADWKSVMSGWRWDAVVHLAGKSHVAEGHTDIMDRLKTAMAKTSYGWNGPCVYASSMTVYGMPEYLAVNEIHPRRPLSDYGKAKVECENMVARLAALGKGRWHILRFPGLFGGGREGGAIWNWVRAAKRGEPLVLADPEPIPWDAMHVDDAVNAIMLSLSLLGNTVSMPINISYGEAMNLDGVAKRIASWGNKGSKTISFFGVKHPTFQVDITRARIVLGWELPTFMNAITRLSLEMENDSGNSSAPR